MTTTPAPKRSTPKATKSAPAKKAAAEPLPAGGPQGGPAPAPSSSFRTEDTNGYHQCRICLLTLPVNTFPTISGPEVRSTRCRKCRDNVSPAVQAKRAAAQAIQEAEALLKTTAAAQVKKPRKQQ